MKVLWFEITQPSRYGDGGVVLGGWQDSLEEIVRQSDDVELTIAFVSDKFKESRVVDGVKYIPIFAHWNRLENNFGARWNQYVRKTMPQARMIVESVKPDIIQVFGTEWPLGQIARYTDIPVVIHIQGAVIPYNNAFYPPGYNLKDVLQEHLFNPHQLYLRLKESRDQYKWAEWERSTWNLVNNYMGRTKWDYAVSSLLHPGLRYYHVDEALRPQFIKSNKHWLAPKQGKLKLLTTGISSFWKGPDLMLKTAKLLKEAGIDFEWTVAGDLSTNMKHIVERHEDTTFEENNVRLLGFVQPDKLSDMLCNCTMMIHTAYIDNSPNSICEAQCLGVPVISTNVGGISTLLHDGIDGILVPANDPWQMAWNILCLSCDEKRMKLISQNARQSALKRHHPQTILEQLLKCYHSILTNS